MIQAVIIVALGILFALYVVPVPRPYRVLAAANFAFFAAFAVAFSMLTGGAASGVDALKFYERGPVAWSLGFESIFQADFMFFLSGALQSVLPLNYIAFNLIGAIFFAYAGVALIMRINPDPSRRALLGWLIFTLLPGVHLWHASFSKEAIQLLLIGCFFGLRWLPLRLGALTLMLLLRPHIGVLMAMAEVGRIMLARKRMGDVLILVAAFVVVSSGMTYLVERLGGTDGFSIGLFLELFSDYGEDWRTSTLRLNDTSSILAYPDFFLRPYPLEVVSFRQVMVTAENLIILGLILFALLPHRDSKQAVSGWFFLVFLCLLLPLINPNVGTATRKKQILVVAAIMIVTRSRRRDDLVPGDVPAAMQATAT